MRPSIPTVRHIIALGDSTCSLRHANTPERDMPISDVWRRTLFCFISCHTCFHTFSQKRQKSLRRAHSPTQPPQTVAKNAIPPLYSDWKKIRRKSCDCDWKKCLGDWTAIGPIFPAIAFCDGMTGTNHAISDCDWWAAKCERVFGGIESLFGSVHWPLQDPVTGVCQPQGHT